MNVCSALFLQTVLYCKNSNQQILLWKREEEMPEEIRQFKLHSEYKPTGDQPQAIDAIYCICVCYLVCILWITWYKWTGYCYMENLQGVTEK